MNHDLFDEMLGEVDETFAFESESPLTENQKDAIFLEALYEQCSGEQEFIMILESMGIDMALYGLVSDAAVCESVVNALKTGEVDEIATEAVKVIKVDNWKQANFSRIEKRTAIRLAENANDTIYTNYAKFRNLMIKYREMIYKKYGAKARTEARQIILASRQKASTISTPGGKSISNRMDAAISNLDKYARNNVAIKK